MSARPPRPREQEMTRLHTVLACLVLVVAFQVVLLLVGVESFARRELDILTAAAFGSGLALAGAGWLVRFILPIGGPDANR